MRPQSLRILIAGSVAAAVAASLLLAAGCTPDPVPVTGPNANGNDNSDGDTNTNANDSGDPANSALLSITPTDFLVNIPGEISPGQRQGPVTFPDTSEQIGVIDIEFVAGEGSTYQSGVDPLPHVSLDNGTLAIDVSSLRLEQGAAGHIGGLRIEPLSASGLSEVNPLRVQALDANGDVLDSRPLAGLPSNVENPKSPQTLDVLFEIDDGPAEIHIIAPPNSFVAIVRIELLNP